MKRKIEQQKTMIGGWRNERHARMLENGIGADVFFLVGKPGEAKELISAHKYMLSAISDVFEGQFMRFNEMTGTKEGSTEEKPIEVPDVSADTFRAMLKFIYAEDFSGVNKLNVLDVYSAGEKYMIDALVKKCRKSLLNDGKNLGMENVIPVLKFAQFHEDKGLIEQCWTFVEKNAKAVIDSEEFSLLEEADLRKMFSRNISDIKEVKTHLLAKYPHLNDLLNIFGNIKFVLISADPRNSVVKFFKKNRAKIEARDGQIVDCFPIVQICVGNVKANAYYLIADTHYRTYKYLYALSLSIPCVSCAWVRECMAQGKLVDHTPFLLPSGESVLEPGRMYPWKPLKGHLLRDKYVIVYSKCGSDNPRITSFDVAWTPLMRNMGATIIGNNSNEPFSTRHRTATLKQKLDFCAKNKFDILLTMDDCEKELAECAQAKGAVAVSKEWVIQAMLTGDLPDVNASEKFRYDFA